jgi:hypothetical protein
MQENNKTIKIIIITLLNKIMKIMMQANRSEIERMLMEQQTVIAQMDNKLKRRKMAQKLK